MLRRSAGRDVQKHTTIKRGLAKDHIAPQDAGVLGQFCCIHSRPSFGIANRNLTCKSPRCVGSPRCGMPSPPILSMPNGLVTPLTVNVILRPSRCVKVRSKPRSASLRVMSISVCRSAPVRWKDWWASALSVRVMSPGTLFGCCSPTPLKVMLSPVAMPRSTLMVSFAFSTRHFCREGTSTCCCMIIGPIWTFRSSISLAHCTLHFLHRAVKCSAQPRQITFRPMLVWTSWPLYSDSRETRTSPRMAGPFSTL
mmetsp:Transcript_71609/g.213708  ORF Transcript_71609/g.213708 Transcript_71609/m.213708 type:complete len:253 (-) Transcript_71609:819-1577(-)